MELDSLPVDTAYRAKPDSFPNLTLKKIPNAVMVRCEWGRDDYSLAIASLPPAPEIDREIREIREKGNAKQTRPGQEELEL